MNGITFCRPHLHFLRVVAPSLALLGLAAFPPAYAEPLLTDWQLNHPSEATRALIHKKKFAIALLVAQTSLAQQKSHDKKAQITVGDWRLDPTAQDLTFRLLTPAQLGRVHYADMYNLEGVAYQGLNKHDKAETSFRQAIVLNPQHCLAHSNLGGALIKQGKLDEAFSSLNKAIHINERFHSAYHNRALVYRARNQFDLERKDLEAWRHWQKQNAVEGLNLSYLSRFEFVRGMLLKNPPSAKNFVALGVLNKELLKFSESEKCFQSALRLDPKLLEAHWAHGLLLLSEQQYAAALKEFSQAIAIDGTFSVPYFNRAQVYSLLHKYDLAVADYTKFIAISAKPPELMVEAYANRAVCYGQLKRFGAGIKDTESALELKPVPLVRASILSTRGTLYEALGDKAKAVKSYEEAMACAPDDKRIMAQRGKLMLSLGEYEQATVDLSTAASVEVSDVSKVAPSQADLRGQIAHYNKLITMFPGKSLDSLYNRGLLYLTIGDVAKAAADMKAVVAQSKVSTATSDSAVCYGSIALRMQKKPAAADDLLRAYKSKARSQPAEPEVAYFLKGAKTPPLAKLLLFKAKHNAKAMTLLGLEAYALNDMDDARKYLSAVRNTGDPSTDEYALAMSYLKRLGGT
ncbi:tetratricopeptide repeat protein [bacterium]|nr:tetratricopeptide repeat protein [bacterium]MBP9810243.1 tetratricopeptide repeat protein [bacterium]